MSNITFTVDADGIAVLTIDVEGRPQNVVTPGFVEDLSAAVDRLAADDSLIGAVLTSGKASGFMAGADLHELMGALDKGVTPVEGAEWFARANAVMRQLETCGKPVVAAINGLALGGGLEFALACHRRVLLDRAGLVVGLPEVTLGLLPGGGGTQRLPRLIGIPKALPLLLEGTTLSPAQALELGVVDELADGEDDLIEAAKRWLRGRPPAIAPWDVKGFRIPGGAGPLAAHAGRSFMAGTSRLKATRANYPAPRAILSAVYEGTLVPFDTAMKIESAYFGQLLAGRVAGRVAGNLVRSFLRKQSARKRAVGSGASLEVRKLGVLGAGMMGAGIANVAAGAGIAVVLVDRGEAEVSRGLDHIRKQRAREVERTGLSRTAADEIVARVTPATDYAALDGADLIIEAVFENRAVKADVTVQAGRRLATGGIFASNTSTLPITGLARHLSDPSRFIGLHFFSPVERMPLVEVITGKETSAETLAGALAFVARLKKTPIVVHDSPGFYTSRVFCTYIDEAMAMLAEGVSPALIENAARMQGFPVSPLAVTDEVSLDLQKLVIDQARADGLDHRFLRAHAAPVIEKLNEIGRLGRKSGGGFYDFAEDGTRRLWPGLSSLYPARADQPSAEDVGKRLLYIQALESARCLAEGVIDDEAAADLGSVLGIGFPAWTGGALSLISSVGTEAFVEDCRRFAAAHGARFLPDAAAIARAADAASAARRTA